MHPEKFNLTEEEISNVHFLQYKIENCFSFLHEEYGYSLKPMLKIHDSEILLFWIDYIYLNPLNHRKIAISYFPFNKDKERENSIALTITREPYDGQDDFLDLALFIKKRKGEFNNRLLMLSHYNVSFDEQANIVFNLLAALLKENANDIISGKIWEEGYYPKW